MDSGTLTYILSIALILFLIGTAITLAAAYGAIDIVADYYDWTVPDF